MTKQIIPQLTEEQIARYNKYLADKVVIKNAISNYYDFQKLRIQSGNRLVASFNIQAGQKSSLKQEEMNPEMKKMLSVLRLEYNRITDAYINNKHTIKKIIAEEQKTSSLNLQYIRSEYDYRMIKAYVDMLDQEENYLKMIKGIILEYPIYTEFLSKCKGVGPVMAAVLIAYIDIYKAKYVSSILKYAGIDTVYDEAADKLVGRTRSYLEEVEYKAKDGTIQTKKSLTYNPFLKTKILGVLGPSFIKSKSDYAVPFYEYRMRIRNKANANPDWAKANNMTPGHINNMAMRYMIKQFLKELYAEWKKLEGLPAAVPYEQAFLGMAPHHYNPYADFAKEHPEAFSKANEEV